MSNKDLRRNSQHTHKVSKRKDGKNENVWWYEESNGIVVVACGEQARISWKQLRGAIARKDKLHE